MPVAVNISAVQFRHKGFLEDVRGSLTETGLERGCLELELTESVLMPDAESTGSTLRALKTLGVQLSVDDFGTGYSSLSYLTQFPIDTLKIDQSFVHKMLLNANDASVISAVISMGRDLNQRVIAEGVETEEQLRFLQAGRYASARDRAASFHARGPSRLGFPFLAEHEVRAGGALHPDVCNPRGSARVKSKQLRDSLSGATDAADHRITA